MGFGAFKPGVLIVWAQLKLTLAHRPVAGNGLGRLNFSLGLIIFGHLSHSSHAEKNLRCMFGWFTIKLVSVYDTSKSWWARWPARFVYTPDSQQISKALEKKGSRECLLGGVILMAEHGSLDGEGTLQKKKMELSYKKVLQTRVP